MQYVSMFLKNKLTSNNKQSHLDRPYRAARD